MSPFPVEIEEEILSRLPVKCLLRLRCVSKSWFGLINTPYFIKLHLNRSVRTKSGHSVFLRSYHLYRVDFGSLNDDDDGVVIHTAALVDYHPFTGSSGFLIGGSCDGLICIAYRKDIVFLWNPSTRKSLKLPHVSVGVPNLSGLKQNSLYRIAYICNDYKVVRIVELKDSRRGFRDYEIMIYSLSSNSWHRTVKCPESPNLNRFGYTVVGGALHWISGFDPELQDNGRIVAFDLEAETYRVIPPPQYRGSFFLTGLYYLEGCLALSCHYNSMSADVWVLKDYGGKNESWSRLITLLPIVRSSIQHLAPTAYSRNGKKVLMEMDCHRLFWYNLERDSIEEDILLHGMEEDDDLFVGCTCAESLVSVDVANARNPHKDEKKMQSISDLTKDLYLGAEEEEPKKKRIKF